MSEDYYKILSVEPTASQKEIHEAADRLISVWNKKRGLSFNKRSEVLSQIRTARAVLADPLQRYEYDIEHGFKRNFSGQALTKRMDFIPLQFSESIEALDTVKIPGQLDYEKLENSIAAMENLTQVKRNPDIKSYYGSESTINHAKDPLRFNEKKEAVESVRKSESVESLQFPSNDETSFDTSANTEINLKQPDLSLFTHRLKLRKYEDTDIPHNMEMGKNTSNKPVYEKNSKEIVDLMKERKSSVVPSEEVTKVLTRLKEELINENSETDFTVDSKRVYGKQASGKQQLLVPEEIQTFSKGKEFLENGWEIKHVDSIQLARKSLLERKRDAGALEYEKFGQQKGNTVRLNDEIYIIPADSENAINTIYKSGPFNKKSTNLKQDFTMDGKKDTEILPNENKSLETNYKIEHVDSYKIIKDHFSRRKTKPNISNVSESENNSQLKSSLATRGEIGKSTSEKHKRSITLSDEITLIPRMEVKSDEGMPRVSPESKSLHSYLRQNFETDETETSYLLPEEIDEIIKHSMLVNKKHNSRRNTEPYIGSTIGDKFSDRRLSLSYDDKEDETSESTSDDNLEIPSEEEISPEASDRILVPSSSHSNLNRLLTLEEERDSKDNAKTAHATDDEEDKYLAKYYKHAVTSKNNTNDKESTKISHNSSKDSVRNSSASNSKNNLDDKENSQMSQKYSNEFRCNSRSVNSEHNPNIKKSSKILTSLSEDPRHNSPATNSKNNTKHKENSEMSPNPSEEESDKRVTSENQIMSHENPTVLPDLDKKKVGEKIMIKNKRGSLHMSSNKENSSRLDQSVSAITRIAGTDIKTVYTFGLDTDSIEVFVNSDLRVKIIKGEKQDVYSNEMKHDDLPAVGNICASTVIAANSCVITTEVTRRGKKESISVYKNDTLLCRTGSSIVEE